MPIAVGSPAPFFSLLDQNREPVSLDDVKGTKSLIVFIPLPFTGICDAEACTLRDEAAVLNDLDANVVVITCHAVSVAKKWADENGFAFPVLSDFWPHGAVASTYGAFNTSAGVSNRVTIVLDADGIVRAIFDSGSLGTPRAFEDYARDLDSID